MKRVVVPCGYYRHFKDKWYFVLTVAENTETGEKLVIYKALYEEGKIYARPLEMFLSEVDKEKYPNAMQENRFEYFEKLEDGKNGNSKRS